MAIVPINAPLLFLEGKKAPYSGRLLQLGRQAIFFNREELTLAAQLCGFVLKSVDEQPLIPYQFKPDKLGLSDTEFFKCLGFVHVDSLDFNDIEENNIVFDLNADQTPQNLMEMYDVVLDGGTMEHVFHLPNFLKNTHNMLKIGGRIIHFSPASNFVEHGFYSFSPCFFVDYYTKNGYEISSVKLIKTDLNKSEYEASFLDLFPNYESLRASLARIGGLDSSAYGLVVVAQKLPTSTSGAIPIQGYYEQRLATSEKKPPEEHVVYPWENGKWVFPWKTLPCFTPDKDD